MMRGMLSAVSGLKAHESMLDVVADNIANVNTVGFKSSRSSFEDAFAQTLRGASGPSGGLGGMDATQIGLGVQLGGTETNMTEGSIQSTGVPLDCAIQGNGFFRVATYDSGAGTFGTPEYTRDGDFTTDSNGNLMTRDGEYVIGYGVTSGALNTTDSLITIPADSASVSIGSDGSVISIDGSGNQTLCGAITLAKFANENALERASGNLFQAPATAVGTVTVGQAGDATKGLGTLVPGALEMSNVDLATEFTNMIVAERGFQANSRAISTADQMLQNLVTLGQ